jgi:hypothetical protein
MTLEILVLWFVLVIVVEAATEILVEAKITELVRQAIRERAYPQTPEGATEPVLGPRRWRFLADLLSCGYCTSVWVAMLAAVLAPWVVRPQEACWLVLAGAWLVNWLLAVLVLHRLSNWLHVVYSLVKKGRVRTYDIELTHYPLTVKVEVDDGGSGQGECEGGPEAGPQPGPEAG